MCVCALQPRGEITWPESSSRERLATQKNYTQPFEREISEGLALFSHSYFFLISLQSLSVFFFLGFLNSYINVCVCTTERELKKPKRNKCRETCNTFFLLRGCGIQKRKFGAGLSPIRDVFSLRLQCRAAHYCRAHTAGGKGRKLVWATR